MARQQSVVRGGISNQGSPTLSSKSELGNLTRGNLQGGVRCLVHTVHGRVLNVHWMGSVFGDV